jgi:hypothetical protein
MFCGLLYTIFDTSESCRMSNSTLFNVCHLCLARNTPVSFLNSHSPNLGVRTENGTLACLLPSFLPYLLTYLLTHSLSHSMVQDIIWNAACHSTCRKIFCFLYGTRRFITMLTKVCHWILSWVGRIQFAPSIPISIRSILILSSHLYLCLASGLLLLGLPTKTL